MGGDKGLVTVGSRPMFMHAVEAVSRVAEDVLLAVGMGCMRRYSDLVGPRVRVVEDTARGRGPLEGLTNAFDLAKGAYIAVVPCDAPLVRPELLQLLASKAVGADGAVPVVRGYVEPLVAVYEREAGIRSFREELAKGIGKASNAVANMDVVRVQEDELAKVDPELLSFWNINSQEDLSRVEYTMTRL